ncbi:hypothetical protein [Roseibium sp. RKSG952]|uniref:hypothetical protein n=1 Tax=Roseibium sp. RKSG952 TaxID=2529384 RepID=UPI0012BCE836|nr:hypothetical protein [Roseibium sp. RKSG952]MTH98128.1 hypothetical protein [Roseibium sp. RKSG952]
MIRFASTLALSFGLFGAVSITDAEATDFFDRLAISKQIQRDAANGGPQVVGANSPFMVRVKVCKDLPLEVTDRKTGRKTTEMTKRCWYE